MKFRDETEPPLVIPGGQHAPLDASDNRHVDIAANKLKFYHRGTGLTWVEIANQFNAWLRKNYGLERADPHECSGDYLKSFASRPPRKRLNVEWLNALYRFLHDHKGWDRLSKGRSDVASVADHPFYSMLEFLQIPELTTSNLLKRLPGVYRVWRPILTHEDNFILGYVAVWADPETGVIRYREYNATKEKDDRSPKKLTLEGYVFRKSSFVFFYGSDTAKSSIHLTLLGDCEIEDDHYIVMMGQFLDTIGNRTYSGRVIMERIPGANADDDTLLRELEESADCHARDSLPQSIQNFFNFHRAQVGDLTVC